METPPKREDKLKVAAAPSKATSKVKPKRGRRKSTAIRGFVKKLKPVSGGQVQWTPQQISKELAAIEKYLEKLKGLEDPWDKRNYKIWSKLLEKYYQYRSMDNVIASIGDLLIKYNFFDVVVKVWDYCHNTKNKDDNYLTSPSYRKMKWICSNFADKCVNLCKEAFRHKIVFERFMRELTLRELSVEELRDDNKRDLVEATVNFLHNALRLYNPNCELVRQNGGIQTLLSYYDSEDLFIKAIIMLSLAYCINEEESDKIFTGTEVVAFITEQLENALQQPDHHQRPFGFSASEAVFGFNKLALNDRNKVSIAKTGALPHLKGMMIGDKFPDEHALAAECLWTLSFHSENKERILREPGLMNAVRRLFNNPRSDEDTRKSCEGIFFNVVGKNASDSPRSAFATGGTKKQHVMISYQWDVQPIILKVRDKLKHYGLNVWLDVDNMQGSILSAIADAVENASVLVVGVTERYKNSNSCRTEAEYAYKLSKPIAPLLLEPHYTADGWLGAFLGTELYVDVSSEDVLNAKVDDIVKMIRSKVGDQTVESEVASPLSFAPSDTVVDAPTNSKPFNKWSTEDVSKWAEETGIDGLPLLLACFDGVALNQLLRLLKRSPDIYHNSLRVDMKLSLLQSLQFTHFLEDL